MTIAKNFVKQITQALFAGSFFFKFSNGKKVYLTFDDGPNEKYTDKIIDILNTFSAKSTFFLVGQNVELFPKIVERIKNDGHAIGLHTYRHKRFDLMTKKEFIKEITLNQLIIEKAVGVKPIMIRPPQGKLNLLNLIWSIRTGLKIVHFTVTSNDWKANSALYVIKAINIEKIGGGEIISFHDNNKHTVEALPVLLEKLFGAGYRCAPIILDYEL